MPSWIRLQCTKAGFSFSPLVREAVGGGWSDALRSVVAWIASESRRSGPIDGSDASFKIAQRISCTLHRENARAFLNRAPEPLGPHVRSLGLSVLPSLSSRNSSSLVVFPGPVPGPAWYLVGVLPFFAQDLRVLCVTSGICSFLLSTLLAHRCFAGPSVFSCVACDDFVPLFGG